MNNKAIMKRDNSLYFHLLVPEDQALQFFETDGVHIFSAASILGSDGRKYLEIGCKIIEIGGKKL